MNGILDTDLGIELSGNDKDLYKELLNLFLDESKFDIKKFDDIFLESKEKAKSYIHRIKGAARQIGATELSDKAQFIEDVVSGKKQASLPYCLNEFCKIYENTLKSINDFLNK